MLVEGEKLPNVKFNIRIRVKDSDTTCDRNGDCGDAYDWGELTIDECFLGKKCILIALPGCFTPTCSSTHLPGYNSLYDEFKKQGIDDIYCISVNDSFVFNEWMKSLDMAENKVSGDRLFSGIQPIPDGTGEFTQKVGMGCFWGTERGFGYRSWRYSAYVDNGVVQKIFVEKPFVQNSKDDPFEVSDANTMLEYLQTI